MAVADYNTTPSLNVTISGINVNTGCPPGNIDNAFRQMMADIKVMYGALPDTSTFMPKSGGAFSGTINRASAGSYLHHADPTLTNGPVSFLLEGSARPSASEGTVVFYYAS